MHGEGRGRAMKSQQFSQRTLSALKEMMMCAEDRFDHCNFCLCIEVLFQVKEWRRRGIRKIRQDSWLGWHLMIWLRNIETAKQYC